MRDPNALPAVKANYAGFEWRDGEFERIVTDAANTLPLLSRTPKTVPPGGYRAYLTPAALAEVWGWLSWGALGLQAHRTRSTPFLRSIDGVEEVSGPNAGRHERLQDARRDRERQDDPDGEPNNPDRLHLRSACRRAFSGQGRGDAAQR